MFFKDRIKHIHDNDRVLEIGPGADPHPRSDILLEIELRSEEEYVRQFGHSEKLVTSKPVVFYDGKKFPFADNEFDYVICSHVLEHVEDVPGFLAELFRVAPRGYLEFPLMLYDYLFNFDVHLNFLFFDGTEMRYMKKSESGLEVFRPANEVLYAMLGKGHFNKMLTDVSGEFFQGFEWNGPFECRHESDLKCYIADESELTNFRENDMRQLGTKRLGKEFLKSIFQKLNL